MIYLFIEIIISLSSNFDEYLISTFNSSKFSSECISKYNSSLLSQFNNHTICMDDNEIVNNFNIIKISYRSSPEFFSYFSKSTFLISKDSAIIKMHGTIYQGSKTNSNLSKENNQMSIRELVYYPLIDVSESILIGDISMLKFNCKKESERSLKFIIPFSRNLSVKTILYNQGLSHSQSLIHLHILIESMISLVKEFYTIFSEKRI